MSVCSGTPLMLATQSVRDVLGPHGWVCVVSFLTAAAATPICRWLAMRFGIVDKPDDLLKPHGRPIAYLGGVAIFLGWVAGMLSQAPFAADTLSWFLALMLAGGLAMIVGLLDDLRNIAPRLKLLGQVGVGVLLLSLGVGLKFATVFFSPFHVVLPDWLVVGLSIPAVLFVVLAATNATNLLDGMDGLCSGVTAIIALGFLVLATHLAVHQYSEAHDRVRIIASLAMFGAVVGFLPYNFNPAKIFMGDAGSLLLGFYAAAMMIMFGERGISRWVLGSVMIFGLPILDTSLALIRRVRLHRPIFAGDRSHLYDQLVDRGFTVRQTVAISYALAIFYVAVGLATSIFIPVGKGEYSLIIYAAVAAVTLLGCWKWGFLTPRPTGKAEDEPPAEPADQ